MLKSHLGRDNARTEVQAIYDTPREFKAALVKSAWDILIVRATGSLALQSRARQDFYFMTSHLILTKHTSQAYYLF